MANGGCQQLCLYRGNGQRACACAHGMLAEDGASCREYAGYLLYSERTILKSIHLSDERNLNAPVQPFEDPEHMKNVIALAFDYRAGTSPGTPNRIFFSDIHFGNIQQINDDGTGRVTIVESKPRFRISQGGARAAGAAAQTQGSRAGGPQAARPGPISLVPASGSLPTPPGCQRVTLCPLCFPKRLFSLGRGPGPLLRPPLVLVHPQAAQKEPQLSSVCPAPTAWAAEPGQVHAGHRVCVTWASCLHPQASAPCLLEAGTPEAAGWALSSAQDPWCPSHEGWGGTTAVVPGRPFSCLQTVFCSSTVWSSPGWDPTHPKVL